MEDLYEELNANIIQINTSNKKEYILSFIQNILGKIKNIPKLKRIPYQLFIAQIYAIKLKNFTEAYLTLNNMVAEYSSEPKNSELLLIYSSQVAYLKFIQQKYEEANQFLKRSIFTMGEDQKLKIVWKSFFARVASAKTGTIDYNLLHGFRQLIRKENQAAFSMFLNVYYKLAKIDTQSQIKYFIQTIMLSLQQNIEDQQHQEAIEGIKEQYQFNSQMNKQYLGWKQFLSTLTWIIFEPEQSVIIEQCCQLQLIAIYKLKKAIYASQQENSDILQLTLKQMNVKMSSIQLVQKRTLLRKFVFQQYQKFRYLKLMLRIFALKQPFQRIKFRNNSQFKPRAQINSLNIFETESQIRPEIKQVKSQMTQQKKLKNFVGSLMTKIHATSDGNEERYFYIKPSQIKKNKYRLYYAKRQDKTTDNDQYYSLKGLKSVEQGKTSKQLQRKSCDNLDERQCFSLITDKDTRSFYVKDKNDYNNWIKLIKQISKVGLSKMTKSSEYLPNDSIIKPMGVSKLKKTKAEFI